MSLQFRALATGTGRVGYASGAWLSYVKAGIAWADLEQTNFAGTASSARRVPITRTGVTAGAGLEWAFWRNLSAKLEYNFIYFGESSIDARQPSRSGRQPGSHAPPGEGGSQLSLRRRRRRRRALLSPGRNRINGDNHVDFDQIAAGRRYQRCVPLVYRRHARRVRRFGGHAKPTRRRCEYVRICSIYGATFFYIPGTDTCVQRQPDRGRPVCHRTRGDARRDRYGDGGLAGQSVPARRHQLRGVDALGGI